jgi:hypothetical protein
VDAINPANAMDFVRGFVYGLQVNQCYYSACYTNTSHFVVEVQNAINLLEQIVDAFAVQNIPNIICNFNYIYLFYERFLDNCDIDGFLYQAEAVFTETKQLVDAFYRAFFHLHYYHDFYLYLSTCDQNFSQCGLLAGEAVQHFIGWHIHVDPTVTIMKKDVPTDLINGVLDSFGDENMASLLEDVKELVRLMGATVAGDANQVYEFVEHYKVAREKFLALNLPTFQQIVDNYDANYSTLALKAAKLLTCDGEYNCGTVIGDILKSLTN